MWSHSIHENKEELMDTHAFPLREFHRRFGTVVDLLMECFQKTVTTIIHLSQPDIQPTFHLQNMGIKGKNNLKNRLKRMRRKAKKRLLKTQNTSGIVPTLGNMPTAPTETATEAGVSMADLQEVLENSKNRPPLSTISGEHMEKRDLPEKG